MSFFTETLEKNLDRCGRKRYNKTERALRSAVQPNMILFLIETVTVGQWRFLLFTMIVTVNCPIWIVIRMAFTPFRGLCSQTAARLIQRPFCPLRWPPGRLEIFQYALAPFVKLFFDRWSRAGTCCSVRRCVQALLSASVPYKTLEKNLDRCRRRRYNKRRR